MTWCTMWHEYLQWFNSSITKSQTSLSDLKEIVNSIVLLSHQTIIANDVNTFQL